MDFKRALSARFDRSSSGPAFFGTVVLLVLIAEALKIHPVLGSMSGDVWLYHRTANGMLGGVRPYLDEPFGYPPYSLLWFLFPLAAAQVFFCKML